MEWVLFYKNLNTNFEKNTELFVHPSFRTRTVMNYFGVGFSFGGLTFFKLFWSLSWNWNSITYIFYFVRKKRKGRGQLPRIKLQLLFICLAKEESVSGHFSEWIMRSNNMTFISMQYVYCVCWFNYKLVFGLEVPNQTTADNYKIFLMFLRGTIHKTF